MASDSPNIGTGFEHNEGNNSDQEVDPEAPTQIMENDTNFENQVHTG